jgi:hypothetical protein
MAKRFRRLWLQIKIHAPGVARDEAIRTLIRSVKNGTYDYPKNWLVGIYWSNTERGDFRSGEFQREMRASRESSSGWDDAVLTYLEMRL